MNISTSKKQLAKIISENGGWPDKAEYSAQDGSDGQVSFYKCGTPIYNKLAKIWNAPGSCVHMYGSRIEGLGRVGVIKNFHQTILSRDEYFHLYPALDAVAEEPEHVWTNPPTIEQLAAEYRNRKDYAERKQQEADEAKAEAEAKLAELVAAGKAVWLVVSVAEPEPEKPTNPYTGRFYNAKLVDNPPYRSADSDELCDGCGGRFGDHYGARCTSGGANA